MPDTPQTLHAGWPADADAEAEADGPFAPGETRAGSVNPSVTFQHT